jgi:hypothetical protein
MAPLAPTIGMVESATEQKKEEVAAMSHAILHIVTKNPEHPHIGYEVQQIGMEEHGTEYRQKAGHGKPVATVLAKKTGRDKAQVENELASLVAVGKLVEKKGRVGYYQPDIYNGEGPGRNIVLEGKHGGIVRSIFQNQTGCFSLVCGKGWRRKTGERWSISCCGIIS